MIRSIYKKNIPLSMWTAMIWLGGSASFKSAAQTVESTPPLTSTCAWNKTHNQNIPNGCDFFSFFKLRTYQNLAVANIFLNISYTTLFAAFHCETLFYTANIQQEIGQYLHAIDSELHLNYNIMLSSCPLFNNNVSKMRLTSGWNWTP